MIIEKRISTIRLLKIIWKRLLIMSILASAIVIPIVHFELNKYAIDITTPLILGTALSIFLGFRTNSAYERWVRGRTHWADIRSSSLNLGMILASTHETDDAENHRAVSERAHTIVKRMIRRNIAWIWVLNRQLKDRSPLDGTAPYLAAEELEIVKSAHNPALKLLFLQSRDFRWLSQENILHDGATFEIVAILRTQLAAQCSCEGLKATPFPTHYTYFTDVFIWLLILLLSMSFPELGEFGYLSIPSIVLIGWVFSMIEGIAVYMDDPFTDNRNVVPMDALSRGLEIDLKAFALDETDLPPTIQPIEGALY